MNKHTWALGVSSLMLVGLFFVPLREGYSQGAPIAPLAVPDRLTIEPLSHGAAIQIVYADNNDEPLLIPTVPNSPILLIQNRRLIVVSEERPSGLTLARISSWDLLARTREWVVDLPQGSSYPAAWEPIHTLGYDYRDQRIFVSNQYCFYLIDPLYGSVKQFPYFKVGLRAPVSVEEAQAFGRFDSHYKVKGASRMKREN